MLALLNATMAMHMAFNMSMGHENMTTHGHMNITHGHNMNTSHGHHMNTSHGHNMNTSHGHNMNTSHGHHMNTTHGSNMNHGHGSTNMSGTNHGKDHGGHHETDHGNTGSDHSSHSGGGHALYFSFILPIRVLFFEWNIESDGQLAASCVGIFLLAVLYEGLKVWRQHLLRIANHPTSKSGSNISSISNSDEFNKKEIPSALSRFCSGWHLLQSLLQAIQTTLGMFLMLIYMTFNVWLALMVSVGSGFGYLFFGWILTSQPDFGDHCS